MVNQLVVIHSSELNTVWSLGNAEIAPFYRSSRLPNLAQFEVAIGAFNFYMPNLSVKIDKNY